MEQNLVVGQQITVKVISGLGRSGTLVAYDENTVTVSFSNTTQVFNKEKIIDL